MGILVDKINRKNLMILVCLCWSITSIISGSTNSIIVLCLMRFILGICVSATEPASYSILGDYFPKRYRTTANAFMNTASYLGAGLSSLIVLIVANYGWRVSYISVGLMGILIAAAGLLFIKEPERGFQLQFVFE